MAAGKTGVHWITDGMRAGGRQADRALRAIRGAIEVTGGEGRKAAAHLDLPWETFLRIVGASGLEPFLREVRGRTAAARRRAKSAAKGRPTGGAHWLTVAHRVGSDAERTRATDAIKHALREAMGDVRAAAPRLGVSATTLYRLLEDFDLGWYTTAAKAEALREKKS